MADMWHAIEPFCYDATRGVTIEARAVYSDEERFDRPGREPVETETYWSAGGIVTYVIESIDGQPAIGLEGDLTHPLLYPGWLTPMHIKMLYVQARGQCEVKLDLPNLGKSRTLVSAQIADKGFILSWTTIQDMTCIRVQHRWAEYLGLVSVVAQNHLFHPPTG